MPLLKEGVARSGSLLLLPSSVWAFFVPGQCWTQQKRRDLELVSCSVLGKVIYHVLDRCLSNLLIAGNSTAFLKQIISVLFVLAAFLFDFSCCVTDRCCSNNLTWSHPAVSDEPFSPRISNTNCVLCPSFQCLLTDLVLVLPDPAHCWAHTPPSVPLLPPGAQLGTVLWCWCCAGPVDCSVPTCFGELCTGSEVLLLRTAQTRLCQCWRFCLCLCSAVCLGHCWFCHSEKCVCPPPTWGTRGTGWEAAWDRWISALCRSSCPACLRRGTIPRLAGFLSGRGWLLRSWGFLACSCLGEWRPSIWMLLPHAVVCCHLIICSLQYSWREVKRGCLVCWELSCWKHTGAWLLHVLSNALFFVTIKWYKSLWLPLTI